MLFPTVDYGVFFLCAFACAWALRRHLLAHKALLLAASCLFYGFWDLRFLPVLLGLSLIGGLVARRLQELGAQRAKKKALLIAGVVASLGTLAFFKYLGLAALTAFGLLELLGIPLEAARLPEIALPIGISFFTFHAISLMVDAYRGQIPVRVRLLDALLYVAFFPQLVAGPILRASSFLPQLSVPLPERVDAARALELIAVGLVKKVLIAQFLATAIVDPVFDQPAAHSALQVLLAVYGYAVQIYCDFSGYSDIAIGSALLLGYHIPENFDAPYRASDPQDFWRRWHISLSSWLRDYLFIPLGGSRHGRGRLLLALAITMILGGLWHGAALTFIAWGAFHGAGLVVHRLWSGSGLAAVQRLRARRLWQWAAPVLTFHFVCLGWVLFRSPSLGAAGELLAALGSGKAVPISASLVAVAVAIGLGVFGQRVSPNVRFRLRTRFARLPLALQGVSFALVVVLLDALGPRGIAPFIYFRF